MDDREIRLECLKLAFEASRDNPERATELARLASEFVLRSPVLVQSAPARGYVDASPQ
jgi:hypothetical protein